MPRLLQRRLRCHYCNSYSRNDQPGIPRTWLCPYCEAVNHLDEHGDIADPPVQTTAAPAPVQYGRARSPTPAMAAPTESPFCDTCQRNQLLVNKTLAEYIPDEDDPDYDKYATSADQYRAELEERYPQVCENCIERVQAQIRAAGYAAKADNLRRILDKSNKYASNVYTPRQFWTLCIIWLAKWTYLFSVLVGLVWHAFGTMVARDAGMFSYDNFSWETCLKQAVGVQKVNQSCFRSPYILGLVKYALITDLLTLWWNPKLKQKTNRPGGRMRGLLFLWFMRIAVLSLRCLSFSSVDQAHMGEEEYVQWFHYIHGIIFAILLLSTIVGWNSVRIDYRSNTALMQPINAHLPSAPNSSQKADRSAYKPARPNHSSFDTMAQSFTSSFPIGKLAEPSLILPPSPTLTSVSSTTHDSDTDTPYMRRRSTKSDDAMDWTPTQRRFATNPPSVLPYQWGESSPPPQPTPARQQHSLFSKPDPNPFRHKIPGAPKAPAQAKADPWKPGIWAPPLKETTKNFFKEDKKDADTGLQGIGVPKNIQRQAELFQEPKLKYDYYGGMKETGLENSFNNLFSK